MSLRYLHFDYAEGTDGIGTLEAMAATWPEQVPAVHAEVARVLDWAHHGFAGRRGPIEEGGDWDYDLQGLQEFTAPEAWQYDEVTQRLSVTAGPPGKPRHTVTVCFSGNHAFCAAFMQHFTVGQDD